jgi:putative transposase
VPDELWELALQRREWIGPLLESHSTYSEDIATQIALKANVSKTTIYRWVAAVKNSGNLSSLLPRINERGGKGGRRIKPEVEALIADTIERFYDTDQKRTIDATFVEIRRLCSNANLPLPSKNTVRDRILQGNGRERTLRREGEAAAYAKHDVHKGRIPDADWPLANVQVDHTLLPVIIVDDVHRRPINRAWITIAIDVFSRMCLGMYLSLDAPSAMSAGMCISNAILTKEHWLNKLQIREVVWPCWGVMGILHVDNAREFRGNMLSAACKEYDIDLHLRPVKKPRYGAHIDDLALRMRTPYTPWVEGIIP